MWSGAGAPSTVTVPSIDADAPGTLPVAAAAWASAEPGTSVASSPPLDNTRASTATRATAQPEAISRNRVMPGAFPLVSARKRRTPRPESGRGRPESSYARGGKPKDLGGLVQRRQLAAL